MNTELSTRESFFTKDTLFYKTLFGLILTITLQNLIAYSVNMLTILCWEVTVRMLYLEQPL